MIPQIINYCWFGRGSKSKITEKCIETWKKILPDYQIIEWNEDNFDIESAPVFVKEAYQEKKYAFVSDYVRLYALNQNGGVYMDTDVEVIKNFAPLLAGKDFVAGFELPEQVMTGLIACTPGHPIITEFMDFYKDRHFVLPNGEYNLETNPVQFTKVIEKRGLALNGKKQILDGNIAIYPVEYFCAFDLHNDHMIKTDNTYTVHHYTGSWNDATLKKKFFKRKLVSILGPERYEKVKAWYKRLRK